MNIIFLKPNEKITKIQVDKYCYRPKKTFYKKESCSHTFYVWTNQTEKTPYIIFFNSNDLYVEIDGGNQGSGPCNRGSGPRKKNILSYLSEEDKEHFSKYKSKKWWNCCF
jgi:hypothetical protein